MLVLDLDNLGMQNIYIRLQFIPISCPLSLYIYTVSPERRRVKLQKASINQTDKYQTAPTLARHSS